MRQRLHGYLAVSFVVFATGCGTMPVPFEIATTANPPPPANTTATDVNLAPDQVASVNATTKATAPEPNVDAQAISPDEHLPAPVVEVPEFKNAKEYTREALRSLAEGNPAYARALAVRAQELDAKNKLAPRIIEQIDLDPSETFGTEFFEHRIGEGESLSKLAGLYLNDPMLFYWLARYNGLEKPGDIHTGQVIRIPGKREQALAVVSEPIEDSNFKNAKQAFEAGNYIKTIELLENSSIEIGTSEKEKLNYQVLLAKAHFQIGVAREKEGNLVEAQRAFGKAAKQDRDNREYLAYVARVDTKLEIENQYKLGEQLAAANKTDDALAAFTKVLQLQPGHEHASRHIKQLQKDRTEQLYRQALAAQKRHDLDKAIALWEQYLVLEPKNENARSHKERAVELKQNLQKFASQ